MKSRLLIGFRSNEEGLLRALILRSGFILLAFGVLSSQAIAVSSDTFFFRGGDRQGQPAAVIEWDVTGGQATFSVTPLSPDHRIGSFAFNTTDQNRAPEPPPSPQTIDDNTLSVEVVEEPTATVRLGGTDHYDWDIFGVSTSRLEVVIDNVPDFATDEDFAVPNSLGMLIK